MTIFINSIDEIAVANDAVLNREYDDEMDGSLTSAFYHVLNSIDLTFLATESLLIKYFVCNFEILVTVLTIFVTAISCLIILASGTNIQKCHQDLNSLITNPNFVTKFKLPSFRHQHQIVNIAVVNISDFTINEVLPGVIVIIESKNLRDEKK